MAYHIPDLDWSIPVWPPDNPEKIKLPTVEKPKKEESKYCTCEDPWLVKRFINVNERFWFCKKCKKERVE